jgi:hypothetical protein
MLSVTTGKVERKGQGKGKENAEDRQADELGQAQCCPEVPELLVNLVWCSDCLRDLCTQTIAETLAEPLDRFLNGLFGQIKPDGDLAQRERVLVSPNIVFEEVK